MDEAERCNRINYIAYGRLIARGTVAEMVRDAGLTTVILEGPGVAEASRQLRQMPGVDQVAAYGNTLHVIGRDGPALIHAAREVATRTGTVMTEAAPSLEDVFIQLMGAAQDNAA